MPSRNLEAIRREEKKVSIEIKKADGVEVYEQKLPSSIFTDTESGRKIEIKTPVATVEYRLTCLKRKT